MSALKELTDRGDAEDQGDIGFMYYEGFGVPQDYAEALKWFRLSAEQGYVYAQSSLTRIYRSGRGVPKTTWNHTHGTLLLCVAVTQTLLTIATSSLANSRTSNYRNGRNGQANCLRRSAVVSSHLKAKPLTNLPLRRGQAPRNEIKGVTKNDP